MIYILIINLILDFYFYFEILKQRNEIAKLKNEIDNLKPKGIKQIIKG
jgi:hypothetical protein